MASVQFYSLQLLTPCVSKGIPCHPKTVVLQSPFPMNAGTFRSVALITAVALASSGCTQLSPGENAAVFGGISGAAAGGIARAAGLSTGESIATGAAVGAVVAATTFIIAKHQASVRQRRIAEARAKAAYQRLLAQRQAEERVEQQRAGERPTKPKGSKPRAGRKMPRYIAVDTEKDKRSSPKAQKAVMIWDTQAQEIVGNHVYDIESTPAVGSTARFETYSAEYVGAGS